MKTGQSIKLTRTIQTRGTCRGITFWQNTFIVAIGNDGRRGVAILDIDGRMLQDICSDLEDIDVQNYKKWSPW